MILIGKHVKLPSKRWRLAQSQEVHLIIAIPCLDGQTIRRRTVGRTVWPCIQLRKSASFRNQVSFTINSATLLQYHFFKRIIWRCSTVLRESNWYKNLSSNFLSFWVHA
jgi:hypothetical protein